MVDAQLRGDWRLLKVIVDLMERRASVYLWCTGTAQTSGKKFLKVLIAVLFRFLAPERLKMSFFLHS